MAGAPDNAMTYRPQEMPSEAQRYSSSSYQESEMRFPGVLD